MLCVRDVDKAAFRGGSLAVDDGQERQRLKQERPMHCGTKRSLPANESLWQSEDVGPVEWQRMLRNVTAMMDRNEIKCLTTVVIQRGTREKYSKWKIEGRDMVLVVQKFQRFKGVIPAHYYVEIY